MDIRITLQSSRYLSSVSEADQSALVRNLHSRDVYNTTLNIPYPYTDADAYFWIRKCKEVRERQGAESTFAIRTDDGVLIGVVGAEGIQPTVQAPTGLQGDSPVQNFRSHRAEIGYWLAPPFWGQGVMTEAVGEYVRYTFREFDLEKLIAHVFEANLASARVLEKNGFRLEGCLRRHFIKDGQFLDARLYGLLRNEVS